MRHFELLSKWWERERERERERESNGKMVDL